MDDQQPDRVPIYHQTNNGSGPFVGGNNYGRIEVVDRKTKAVLDKLSQEAPALAALLTKALKDGLISRDTVFSLELAARNINSDVADALYMAGRNINHDVAQMLSWAGDNINERVARQIADAANQLEEFSRSTHQIEVTSRNLSAAVSQLHNLDGMVNALDGASENIAMAASRVSSASDWSWKSFMYGAFVCLILVTALMGFFASAQK